MIAHAHQAAPAECCGLLIGSGDRIDEAVATGNIAGSPTRYEIDPRDHFAVIRRVRREGREILGAYHSHPATPPIPSPADIAAAYDETLLHLIVSLRMPDKPEVRGYRISNGNFTEVPLVPVP